MDDFVINTLQTQTQQYGVQPKSCTANSSVLYVNTKNKKKQQTS